MISASLLYQDVFLLQETLQELSNQKSEVLSR